jgi:uncharacterized protein YdeI (BOF family)
MKFDFSEEKFSFADCSGKIAEELQYALDCKREISSKETVQLESIDE